MTSSKAKVNYVIAHVNESGRNLQENALIMPKISWELEIRILMQFTLTTENSFITNWLSPHTVFP